ncbi:MAG: HEAT repeat domain-containing protein [Planctomycetota bacterium]|nr:HEAT repeat domain-containing protein [Planctomycetota bacterium]MDI6787455.1 HEAT repeat domain-containing protein [Planctomycetota bacterium]
MLKRVIIVILLLFIPEIIGTPLRLRTTFIESVYGKDYSEYLNNRIQELIKQLGSEDYQQREKATDELIEISAPAKESVQKALTNPDTEIRERAQTILPLILWKEAFTKRLNRFISQLRANKIEDQTLFQDVTTFLSRDESAFILVEFLKTPNQPTQIRQQITNTLANISSVSFKPVVGDLLDITKKEKDEQVRVGLLKVLARTGKDERIVSLALGMLKEGSSNQKATAVNVLADMGETSAVEEIIKIVKESDVNLKNTILYALNRFRTEQSLQELVRFMKEESTNWLRAQATGLLANYSDTKLIPEFLWVLKNEKDLDVLRNTLYALQRFRDNKTVSAAIMDFLKTAPPPLQPNVMSSLQTLGDRAAIPELIKILEKETDYSNFHNILNSLQALAGGQKFTPPLIPQTLKDEIIGRCKEWWEKNK